MDYYKGMKTFKQSKYIAVYMPEHHRANSTNGSVYVHILQMESKLGRELKSGEVVHHIDENKHNNSEDNLMCFRTVSDHTSFHNGGELLKNDDGSYSCEKTARKNICPRCGREKTVKAKMCADCRKNVSKESSVFKDTTREELKALIREKSFIELGKMFGCSDNNVRKKCKELNLPFKRTVIISMDDVSWSLL